MPFFGLHALHSTCPTCHCLDPVQTWLNNNLTRDRSVVTPIRAVWDAYYSDAHTGGYLTVYSQAAFTKAVKACDAPHNQHYQVTRGKLEGWRLTPSPSA